MILTDDPDTAKPDDPTETEVVPETEVLVYAAKVSDLAEDRDGNRRISPGDLLAYHITLEHDGVAGRDVVFTDQPDPNTLLLPESVYASQGTVQVDERGIRVEVGELAGYVGITFQVAIPEAVPATVTHIANQGLIVGSNFFQVLTDDPRTPEPEDPTVDPLESLGVPTLGQWGMAVLVTTLASAAVIKGRIARSA